MQKAFSRGQIAPGFSEQFVMGINDFVHACLTGFINNFDPKKIILSIIAQSGDASSQIRMD
jgi:hypothetical protein